MHYKKTLFPVYTFDFQRVFNCTYKQNYVGKYLYTAYTTKMGQIGAKISLIVVHAILKHPGKCCFPSNF